MKIQLDSFAPDVISIACEKLAVPVILGSDFCEKFVEGIYPGKKYMVLDYASTIAVIRKASGRAVREAEVQNERPETEGNSSPVTKMLRGKKIPAGGPVWVPV